MDDRNEGGLRYYVESVLVHPDRGKGSKYSNDIAMITLTTEIQFSPLIQPASLPTGGQRAVTGDKVGTYYKILKSTSKTFSF